MEVQGTVDKAVDVLFHLHSQPRGQGVTAIGRALGLPKSSAHRLLASLRRRGLVERDDGGRYRPGMGLVALGLGVLEADPLAAAARPVLDREAQTLGETFFLVAARGGQLRVLDKAEGTGFLRASPRVGEAVPLHATAVGRLFLAFGDGELRLPEAPLPIYTRHTPVDVEQVLARAAGVREAGFAESREEWIAGLAVWAAPVFQRGHLAGAVALAVPSARVDTAGGLASPEPPGPLVIRAAGQVEARLAGTDPGDLAREAEIAP